MTGARDALFYRFLYLPPSDRFLFLFLSLEKSQNVRGADGSLSKSVWDEKRVLAESGIKAFREGFPGVRSEWAYRPGPLALTSAPRPCLDSARHTGLFIHVFCGIRLSPPLD